MKPTGTFCKGTVVKMGKRRMIEVPKNEYNNFKIKDRVIVFKEEATDERREETAKPG